jgi:glycosyltransferase involved in cell wall biosynthesis
MYHFFRKKEDEYVAHADYNVCLTYAAKKEILSWEQIPNQNVPVEVIPCCVDLELFNPDSISADEKKKLKEELHISENDFIVSYLGSIGGWYLTDEMMRFCKLLSDKMPNAKFLFISPHLHSVIVEAAAKQSLSPEKLIVRKGLRHEVPLLLSLSNYSIFFIKPCYSKIASSPTKHGEIMAMGIPVITNKGVGDVEEILNKYQSGFLVNDFSDSSYDKVINEISQGHSFNTARIREGAHDFYNVEIAVSRYLKVYNKILETAEKKS